MPRDVDDLIERWDVKGLLEQGQADALRAEVAAHDASPGPSGEGRRILQDGGNLFEVAISAGLEALGYLGSALVIGALAYLTDVTSWPEPALLVLLAAVTMTTAIAVHQWTPADPGAQSRLVTVVGSAGLAALLGFFALLFDPPCTGRECGWFSHRLSMFIVVAPGTLGAAWLHFRERNAITHAWFGIGIGTTVWMVSQAFLPVTAATRTEEVVGALFLLPAALAWIWFTETDAITPPWIGTFGAAGLSAAMVAVLADFSLFEGRDAVPLGLLVLGAGFITAGVAFERWRLTLVGSLVLVWAVPWTMTEVLNLTERTTALLLLPVGLALVIHVVRTLTADQQGAAD